MQRLFSSLACVPFAIAALISTPASAAIEVQIDGLTDVDPVTPGIQLDPGTYSATINVFLIKDNTIGDINTIGFDVLWTSGTATVTATSAMRASALANAATAGLGLEGAQDIVSDTFRITEGDNLASEGLALPTGFDGSFGGIGYSDRSSNEFGGALQAADTGTFLIASATVDITGGEFDSILFTPTGILEPGVGAMNGANLGYGTAVGDFHALQQQPYSFTQDATTFSTSFNSAGVSFVPEPGSAAGLLALAGCVAWRSRRRSA